MVIRIESDKLRTAPKQGEHYNWCQKLYERYLQFYKQFVAVKGTRKRHEHWPRLTSIRCKCWPKQTEVELRKDISSGQEELKKEISASQGQLSVFQVKLAACQEKLKQVMSICQDSWQPAKMN
jgi:hypothetical protein